MNAGNFIIHHHSLVFALEFVLSCDLIDCFDYCIPDQSILRANPSHIRIDYAGLECVGFLKAKRRNIVLTDPHLRISATIMMRSNSSDK